LVYFTDYAFFAQCVWKEHVCG